MLYIGPIGWYSNLKFKFLLHYNQGVFVGAYLLLISLVVLFNIYFT
jgi:hypothetical protein